MSRKRVGLAIALTLCAAALALILVARSRRLSHADTAAQIDHQYEPIGDMMAAPEGSSPCETAYNAFVTFDDSARRAGRPPEWDRLPDRETFLARCTALPAQVQECLQPRFQTAHPDVCGPIMDKYRRRNPLIDVGRGPVVDPKPSP